MRQRGPSEQQQQRQCEGDETAPQIVEELPQRKRGQRICEPALAGTGHEGKQPTRQLPVAANPPVPAPNVRAIARRMLLVELHVAQKPRSRVAALEQVVAEDAVVEQATPES